eukprot:403345909
MIVDIDQLIKDFETKAQEASNRLHQNLNGDSVIIKDDNACDLKNKTQLSTQFINQTNSKLTQAFKLTKQTKNDDMSDSNYIITLTSSDEGNSICNSNLFVSESSDQNKVNKLQEGKDSQLTQGIMYRAILGNIPNNQIKNKNKINNLSSDCKIQTSVTPTSNKFTPFIGLQGSHNLEGKNVSIVKLMDPKSTHDNSITIMHNETQRMKAIDGRQNNQNNNKKLNIQFTRQNNHYNYSEDYQQNLNNKSSSYSSIKNTNFTSYTGINNSSLRLHSGTRLVNFSINSSNQFNEKHAHHESPCFRFKNIENDSSVSVIRKAGFRRRLRVKEMVAEFYNKKNLQNQSLLKQNKSQCHGLVDEINQNASKIKAAGFLEHIENQIEKQQYEDQKQNSEVSIIQKNNIVALSNASLFTDNFDQTVYHNKNEQACLNNFIMRKNENIQRKNVQKQLQGQAIENSGLKFQNNSVNSHRLYNKQQQGYSNNSNSDISTPKLQSYKINSDYTSLLELNRRTPNMNNNNNKLPYLSKFVKNSIISTAENSGDYSEICQQTKFLQKNRASSEKRMKTAFQIIKTRSQHLL